MLQNTPQVPIHTIRIVIPPNTIPEHRPQPVTPRSTHVPSQSSGGCLCGTIKILGGCISYPFVCVGSCIAGTAYTLYHMACCNINQKEILNRRDTFCTCCGFGTACVNSCTWIEYGIQDMTRPKPQQDMIR